MPRCCQALAVACCVACLPAVHAGPLGLPDSARPGAVRPEDVGKPTQPPPPAEAVMDIPAVIDRPLEVDEGPRVMVRGFRLLGANDIPEYDVSIDEIQALLATQIAEYPEGMAMGHMQIVADEVTRYYREKGLILAQAVIPVQSVEGDIVDMQIFEGTLGRVLAEGNDMYSAEILTRPFQDMVGKPVHKDRIESALLTLTDFPGLTVFGVFQPGQQVGTADIVLRVQEEKRFDISYRIDNHGLQETGRARFRPVIEWNGPTGADRVIATVQQTYAPKNNNFLAFDYERFLGSGFKGGVFFNKNRFDVGGELERQDITGESEQNGVWLERAWFRSRQFNMSTRMTVTRKESQQFTRDRSSNRDRLSVFALQATMDHVDTRFKGINFATIEYSRGINDVFGAMGSAANARLKPAGFRPSRTGGNGQLASGQFDKLFITASRLQTVRPNTSLLVRSEYQWTSDLLTSLEQYSVGGPDNVRAYPQAQFLLDRALFFSVELIQNMPFITNVRAFGNRTWGELVQLSLFYDHAVGRLNNPLSAEPDNYINFRGAGVQARFTLPGKIESRIMWAWQFEGRDHEIADNDRRPQLWGDLTYRF